MKNEELQSTGISFVLHSAFIILHFPRPALFAAGIALKLSTDRRFIRYDPNDAK
jgi:hypothetical protein